MQNPFAAQVTTVYVKADIDNETAGWLDYLDDLPVPNNDPLTGMGGAWIADHDFADGACIAQPDGTVYVCLGGGHSAVMGNGPNGTGTGIADGTCTWASMDPRVALVTMMKGIAAHPPTGNEPAEYAEWFRMATHCPEFLRRMMGLTQ